MMKDLFFWFRYALGGFDGDKMVSNLEIFDPRLGTWMTGEPMKHSRGYGVAVVVKDSVYAIGGVENEARIVETVSNKVPLSS